jgi:hypothetical protein
VEKQILVQYVTGVIAISIGLWGIFAPLERSIFAFKDRGLGLVLQNKLSATTLRKIPKIIGYIMLLGGCLIIAITAFGIKFARH